jgi:hypothetical protein
VCRVSGLQVQQLLAAAVLLQMLMMSQRVLALL